MEDNRQGPGCLTTIIAILAIIGILLAGAGSGSGGKPKTTEANTTSVLSGNELLSRNQVNLFSDVVNEFYDCVGAGSCIVTTDNSTTESTTSTSTRVEGGRDVVIGGNGDRLCRDESTGIYSDCEEGQ
jgi:hypothetical protein